MTNEMSSWDGLTLEESLILALQNGEKSHVQNLALLLALLPESKKEHYRLVWKSIKEKKD